MTITDSTISNNLAGDAGESTTVASGGIGGGIFSWHDAVITGSTISGNTAGASSTNDGGDGGGIYSTSVLTMTNSTVSGNTSGASTDENGSSGSGGGIQLSSPAIFRFVTIYGNQNGTATYPGLGGGIYSEGDVDDQYITIGSSILAGNYSPSGISNDCYSNATLLSEDYNLIGSTNYCIPDISPEHNILEPVGFSLPLLADNGGPTQTHALLAGNPAIDAANPVDYPEGDQRGYYRPVNGVADIGAFEFNSVLLDILSWLPIIKK